MHCSTAIEFGDIFPALFPLEGAIKRELTLNKDQLCPFDSIGGEGGESSNMVGEEVDTAGRGAMRVTERIPSGFAPDNSVPVISTPPLARGARSACFSEITFRLPRAVSKISVSLGWPTTEAAI